MEGFSRKYPKPDVDDLALLLAWSLRRDGWRSALEFIRDGEVYACIDGECPVIEVIEKELD